MQLTLHLSDEQVAAIRERGGLDPQSYLLALLNESLNGAQHVSAHEIALAVEVREVTAEQRNAAMDVAAERLAQLRIADRAIRAQYEALQSAATRATPPPPPPYEDTTAPEVRRDATIDEDQDGVPEGFQPDLRSESRPPPPLRKPQRHYPGDPPLVDDTDAGG